MLLYCLSIHMAYNTNTWLETKISYINNTYLYCIVYVYTCTMHAYVYTCTIICNMYMYASIFVT